MSYPGKGLFSSLLLLLIAPVIIHAKVTLPALFTSGMVIQRNSSAAIWGWADAGENVSIKFNGKTYTTTANKDGRWLTKIRTGKAGGPYELQVNEIALSNILLGDIFICSGQSNMAFMLKDATGGAEAIASSANDMIRLFTVPKDISFSPKEDMQGAAPWQICGPATTPNFSAVAYYMAADLQQKLKVPIGLIHTSYGGTYIEDFISKPSMDTIERLRPIYASIDGQDEKSFLATLQNDLRNNFPGIRFYNAAKEIWDTAKVNLPQVNDNWSSMKLPTLWEKAGLDYTDGVIWFAKEIYLAADDLGKDGSLSLGRIADQSIAYVNGQQVGSSPDSRDFVRQHGVAAGVLKAGKNMILVRVANKARNGGIWGPASKLFFQTGAKKIDLAGDWKYSVEMAKLALHPNDIPSSLYNAMTHQLINFSNRGIIWYQGDSNANWADEYEVMLKLLINDWRKAWKQPDLPFVTIQLPNYDAPGSAATAPWAIIREAQWNSLRLPSTGVVTTIDVGDAGDIHPKNKKPVGERLALQVLKTVYRQKVLADGPVYDHQTVEGNKIRLHFRDNTGRLSAKDPASLKEFMIAGDDKRFVPAHARIEKNTIVVWSDAVKVPTAVRYAWANNPVEPGLYNTAGLPASPFRTDTWKIGLERIPR
ncbi:MAG: sialate O-acetylesterase [Chitinophagaceae bacterium]